MRKWTWGIAVCATAACLPLAAQQDGGPGADATADAAGLTDATSVSPDGGEAADAAGESGQDATQDVVAPDATTARCDFTKPFGTPKKLDGVSTPEFENSARLTPDERTIYYVALRLGISSSHRFFVATRATVDAPFGGETEIAGSFDKSGPALTDDGLTMFHFSFVPVRRWEIYASTRASTSVPFDLSASQPVAAVNTPSHEMDPFVAYDGALWLTSNRPTESGTEDIFRAAKNGTSFDAPVAVTELNSPGRETMPVLSADGRTVYFGSDRLAALATDGGATGYHDVWMAHRSSVNDPFGTPRLVSEVSSGDTDWPTWISPDECRLYFASNRNRGSLDIYVADRTK